MKSIKALGLAVFTALALIAFPGAASASPGFFVADDYPAALTGEATGETGKLNLLFSTGCISPKLTGTLGKASETFAPSSSFCAAVKMNGCGLIFHPPVEGVNGSFDIGGAGCTGIEVSQSGLKQRILPQTGLAATFENEGSGASATVKIHAQATGIKYEVLEGGAKGSYSNGTYTTTWSLKGENGGSPTGVHVVPYPGFSVIGGGEQYAEFHSDLYPAAIGGEQVAGEIGGKKIQKIELTTAAGIVKCNTATFSTEPLFPNGLVADASELVVSPEYSGCVIAGAIPATVTHAAGCSYTLGLTGGAPYVGSLFLCQGTITLPGLACTITVSGQTRSGMEYVNLGSGSGATVEAKANLSGVDHQIANGKSCPNQPADGSYNTGKYKGVVSLKVTKVN
ncbi:MAG TPA: hypothetical protein VIS95_03785 [Solirubrobacterales bacterium]